MKINRVGRLALPDFQTASKAIAILWYQHKSNHTDEWNKTDSRNRPHTVSQLVFNKFAKRKTIIGATKGTGKTEHPYRRKETSTLISCHTQKLS